MNTFNDRTILAKKLAKVAGNEIKRILHNEDIHTKGKGLNDVVTIADTKSEDIIVKKIKECFPNDTIIAEEGGKYQNGNNEYSWAIDPLDGKKYFIWEEKRIAEAKRLIKKYNINIEE